MRARAARARRGGLLLGGGAAVAIPVEAFSWPFMRGPGTVLNAALAAPLAAIGGALMVSGLRTLFATSSSRSYVEPGTEPRR